MSGFGVAMTAWLGVLSAHGCEMSHFMNGGASEKSISDVEASIGFTFTEDLKALYLWADGQENYIGNASKEIVYYEDGGADVVYEIDPSPGKYLCPLFGRFAFESLNQSLDSYFQWIEIIDTLSASELLENITVPKGHTVDGVYFKKGWFPISNNSAGDSIAVDFDPPKGGTYGQIIVIGPNEDERRVLATSVTEFLIRATACDSLNPEYVTIARGSPPIIMDYEMECW